MMASPAEILYRLQLLDTELSERQSRLREIKGSLGESAELIAARRAYEQATKEFTDWRARLLDLELDLQSLNDRIAATEKRLYGGQVTNPKELGGLQRDLDFSKRSLGELEDKVLLAMTRVDDCEKALAETSERLAIADAKSQRVQGEAVEEIEGLQAKVAALSQGRAELAPRIGGDELALYEQLLRKKGGRAVALLVGQVCQGCRVTVPTMKAQQVRRGGDLITCTTCGRILFAGE